MSNSVDGDSDFDCGDYASWEEGIGCLHDEEMVITAEADWMNDPFFDDDEEENVGGELYPPQPGTTDCEVAYDCSTGGGGGSDPLPEPEDCPIGQVKDAEGNCIEGEVPCEGNPVKNPSIAVQNNSGVNGGRYGYTRSGGEQFHSGLDLKNNIGGLGFHPLVVILTPMDMIKI